MTLRGHVRNGVVLLDGHEKLEEGTAVSVRPLKSRIRGRTSKSPSSRYDCYRHLIGKAEGLPPDFSINHDHYLYGAAILK